MACLIDEARVLIAQPRMRRRLQKMQQEIQADAEELLDEETRIHKKVGELEVSLETVGRDISQIKGNMEKLMTHLKISPADV